MAESDDEVYFDCADAALHFAQLRWVLGELDEAMGRVEALSVSPPPSPPSSPVPSPPPFPPSAATCDAAMAVISRHFRRRARPDSPPAKYDPWSDVGVWILAPSAVAAAGLIFDAAFPACKNDDDFPFSLFYKD